MPPEPHHWLHFSLPKSSLARKLLGNGIDKGQTVVLPVQEICTNIGRVQTNILQLEGMHQITKSMFCNCIPILFNWRDHE
jgi:hypothetical protein